jgi:hypothetical protein
MNREVHVQFCGNIGVKLPGVTRLCATSLENLVYESVITICPDYMCFH